MSTDLKNFYASTYEAWKKGLCLEFMAESKKLAENNDIEEFSILVDKMTGNSLTNIEKVTGFMPDEVLLFSRAGKIIVTNKRYFLSEEKDISKQFDAYLLENIKSASRSNISYMTIKLNDGTRIRYYYSGDWITREGIEKALKILPTETPNELSVKYEVYTKIEKDKESKSKITRFTKEKLTRALIYTAVFTVILFIANIIFNRVPVTKSFVQVIFILPGTFIVSFIIALFTVKTIKSD